MPARFTPKHLNTGPLKKQNPRAGKSPQDGFAYAFFVCCSNRFAAAILLWWDVSV